MISKINRVLAGSFLSAALGFATNMSAQTAAPSPTPVVKEVVAANREAIEDRKQEAAKPAPTPEPDFWHQEAMTGD